jgi:hypothetical protein
MSCDRPTRWWIPLFGFCIVLLLAAPPSLAKKPKKEVTVAKEHVVALFLVGKDKPKEKLVNAIAAELAEAPKAIAGLRLITSTKLKKALGRPPETAVTKCGTEVKCIAKLGKEAKAEQVVYARVSPEGAGVSLQILVVSVSSQIIEKKMSIEIAAAGDVQNAIVSRLGDIFPVAAAPTLATDDSGSDEIPLDAVLPTEPNPASTPPVAELASLDLVPVPKTTNDGSHTARNPTTPTTPANDSTTNSAAVAPKDAAPPPPPAKSGRSKILTYAGIGVAGLGAAVAGAGGYFGMQSKSIGSSIKQGPAGTPQIRAAKKQTDANAAANRANLMFEAGGAAVALGAVLIAIDIMTGPKAASTSVTLGAHPSGATLTWSF